MNSYLTLDYSRKTHKKICRKIIRGIATSFAALLGSKLEYIGMGSLFYEDFIDFFSSGWINDMISIEYMLDSEGVFDDLKYKRFLLNRPYKSICLMPMSVREAVCSLSFDKHFLTWFDYDSAITRETIEETAEVIRKAKKSGVLVNSTGAQNAYIYKTEGKTLDMKIIRSCFEDMLTPETADLFESLDWQNFTQSIRDAVTPYYQHLVTKKNKIEHKSYQLIKAGRIEYRQPSLFVTDLWLLVDTAKIGLETIKNKVLSTKDAGFHRIDMPILTKREKKIIGSRLDEDPAVLADELALDSDSIRKYFRYWDYYIE